uniref:BTB domain-containing protein n=2 Tax=Oryza brachyantha TaxID=4533 RepID=J3LC42_ORYBR
MGGDSSSSTSAIVAGGASGSHVLRIDGYSRTRALLENGRFTSSSAFSVGGYNWTIKYFPNGSKTTRGYLSIYLVLDSAGAKDVKAQFSFGLVGGDGIIPVPSYVSRCSVATFPCRGADWGFTKFIKHDELEESEHLIDDSFAVRCDLTVLKEKEIRLEETRILQRKKFVAVPPPNLGQQLGEILKNMDGADVVFEVGDERFSAHTCVLAARSSVFKAELLGAMSGGSLRRPLRIEDMEPAVFRRLLHFMYTDSLSLPSAAAGQDELAVADVVMAQHLLVAADRYNVERLKLMCEERLAESVGSCMVATVLALAEQHSCHGLKEACFEFLASRPNLLEMMASDGYEHLKSSCPSVLMELTARFLPPEPKKK